STHPQAFAQPVPGTGRGCRRTHRIGRHRSQSTESPTGLQVGPKLWSRGAKFSGALHPLRSPDRGRREGLQRVADRCNPLARPIKIRYINPLFEFLIVILELRMAVSSGLSLSADTSVSRSSWSPSLPLLVGLVVFVVLANVNG